MRLGGRSHRGRESNVSYQIFERIPLVPKSRTTKQRQYLYSKYIAIVLLIFVLYGVYHVNPFRGILSSLKGALEKAKPLVPSIPPKSVLIVGAGPAGVSTAWSIYQEAKKQKIKTKITVIEQKSMVGGRMQVSKPLEIASISVPIKIEDIATGNLWDKNFVRQAKEIFNFEPCGGQQNASNVGFWNGERLVEELREPINGLSWFSWFKLNFKYGIFWYKNIQKLKSLSRFDEGYSTKTAVDSVVQMLESFKLGALVDTNAFDFITENLGISEKYIHEVLEPQIRRQLGGQNLAELHLLAVSRALNIEDDHRCSGRGLYEKALERYLSKSNVDLKLNSKVLGLERVIQEGKFVWKAQYESFGNGIQNAHFDHIIVTGPSNLTSLNENIEHGQEQDVEYKSTWVTYFVSETTSCILNTRGQVPKEILPIHDPRLLENLHNINEIFHVQNFYNEYHDSVTSGCIYKTLSNSQVSNLTVGYAAKYGFVKRQEFEIEKAYPLLYVRRIEYGSFKVQEGLWRTGVVEAAGSDASLSWAAGEIVGRLVLDSQQNEV